jgi:hypothetical protein
MYDILTAETRSGRRGIDKRMSSVTQWLTWSLIGLIFSFFPVWWWLTGGTVHAVVFKKQKVAIWMFKLAGGKNLNGEPQMSLGLFPAKYVHIPWRVLSVFFVIASLVMFHYGFRDTLINHPGLFEILSLESSLPFFLLFSWLISIYFIERYFKRLNTVSGQNDIKNTF